MLLWPRDSGYDPPYLGMFCCRICLCRNVQILLSFSRCLQGESASLKQVTMFTFFLSQWLVDYGKLSMCALSNVDFFDIAISTAVYFLGWFLSVGLLCMLCGHVPDWVQTLLVFCSIYFNVGIGARVLDYHLASYSTWNTLLVCHVSLYGPILMKKLDLCLHGCLE